MIRPRILLLVTAIICVGCGTSWYLVHRRLVTSLDRVLILPGQYNPDACWVTETRCLSRPTGGNFQDIREKRAIAPDDHFAFDPFSEGLLLTKHHLRWGYRDASGKMVISAQFKDAHPFREHRAAVMQFIKKRGYLWGFIDPAGKTVIRPQFHHVRNFSEGLAAVEIGRGKRARWGFVDLSGNMAIPARFRDAIEFSEGLAGARRERDYGYIDHRGEYVIPPRFDQVFDFSDGRARVSNGVRFGYIDKTGNIVIPIRYSRARDFAEERAAVFVYGENCADSYSDVSIEFEHRGRWGYIDLIGKLVIPGKYTTAEDFSEGLAAVTGSSASYIDKQGNSIIVTSPYHGSFYQGLARIGYRYKTYIDKTGAPFTPPYLTKMSDPYPRQSLGETANGCSYRRIFCPPTRLGSFAINGKQIIVPDLAREDPRDEQRFPTQNASDMNWGYRDSTGRLVIPYQFSIARPFSEYRAAVQTHRLDSAQRYFLWGYVDPAGQMAIAPQFADAKGFSEGLAAVAVGPGDWLTWGFIEPSGKLVIPANFDKAENFSEGVAAVRVADGTYGYIDHSGKFVVAPRFQYAFNFANGRARIQCGSKTRPMFGYIDKKGKIAVPCGYADAGDFSEGRAAVLVCPKRPCANEIADGAVDSQVWGRWGYIDANGKIVVPFRYRWAEDFSEGLAAVTTAESEGQYIDRDGKVVILTDEYHERFVHGIARIGNAQRKQPGIYIDKTGKPLLAPSLL